MFSMRVCVCKEVDVQQQQQSVNVHKFRKNKKHKDLWISINQKDMLNVSMDYLLHIRASPSPTNLKKREKKKTLKEPTKN